VAACYDRHRERASNFAAKHGIPSFYDSVESALDGEAPSALTVAVADPEHFSVAEVARRRDVALFVEKPLTGKLAEAEALLAIESSALFVCNFSKLNYPAIFGALHLLKHGTLGRPRAIRLEYLQSWLVSTVWGEWWKNPRWLWRISGSHRGGGALRDLGSHLFYLLLAIAGECKVVRASAWNEADRTAAADSGYSCDLNDSFEVELTCANGAYAVVTASYARPGHVNNVRLMAECDNGSLEVELATSKERVHVSPVSRTGTDRSMREVRFKKVYSTYEEFLRLLRNRGQGVQLFSPPSLKEGVEVQQMISRSEDLADVSGDAAGAT
jgi:predicted dehydrogenase